MYDNSQYYGAISRALHWLMAVGFLFMLFTATMWNMDDKYFSLMGAHKAVGVLLMVLVLVRLVWAVLNWTKRPYGNLAVKLGHLALYVLMIAVPLVGLLRQYGSGRELNVFGLVLMEKSADKIESLVQLGNVAHGKLAWALFALVAGHIGMAVLHQIKGEKIINRMAGR
ncbi:cytochrome b [Kingella negevensis]|uniref:cytochrome b n=1 Tax=Kingella negevensis TaxID=1522312 RepID=UPI00050A03E5|nr:cytochrome b/b6 domain-containing protein [Kingella negevensis]MDK4687786.1 cytochrome b/b6 domain-containing protein [Kingella negevensis]WII91218.1 cytochrome b/b6 domain-containing protein [Kingella negevensis]